MDVGTTHKNLTKNSQNWVSRDNMGLSIRARALLGLCLGSGLDSRFEQVVQIIVTHFSAFNY